MGKESVYIQMVKYLAPVILIIILVAGLAFYKFQSSAPSKPTQHDSTSSSAIKEELKKPLVETIVTGIKRLHGIGFNKGVVYVSSETDKILYKVIGGKAEKFVELNFTHDMIFEDDGSIITPVFNENRLVKISPTGQIETLFSGLSGPNGVVKDEDGNFIVSNYNSNQVLALKTDGTRFDISHKDHKGPAGLAFIKKGEGRSLDGVWVASFLSNTFSEYHLDLNKKGSQLRAFNSSPKGITHFESLYYTTDKKLLATAVKDGKGVVVEVLDSGRAYNTLLETDLPDPLVGYFTSDGEVYLVSPNDQQGRILRSKLF